MFKIGERIICVKGHQDPDGVKEGNIYTIKKFACCSQCGRVAVDVGFEAKGTSCSCDDLQTASFPKDGAWYFGAWRFRPYDELQELLTNIEESSITEEITL